MDVCDKYAFGHCDVCGQFMLVNLERALAANAAVCSNCDLNNDGGRSYESPSVFLEAVRDGMRAAVKRGGG